MVPLLTATSTVFRRHRRRRGGTHEAVIRDQMHHEWYITTLYSAAGAPGEDEVQLAYRSLGMAVDGFDPQDGGGFLSYAVPVIRSCGRSKPAAKVAPGIWAPRTVYGSGPIRCG